MDRAYLRRWHTVAKNPRLNKREKAPCGDSAGLHSNTCEPMKPPCWPDIANEALHTLRTIGKVIEQVFSVQMSN